MNFSKPLILKYRSDEEQYGFNGKYGGKIINFAITREALDKLSKFSKKKEDINSQNIFQEKFYLFIFNNNEDFILNIAREKFKNIELEDRIIIREEDI